MSVYTLIVSKGQNLTKESTMKSIIVSVYKSLAVFFSAVAQASYAAHQARNGQIKQAQSHYK
jgi:hypothetical protein